MKKILGLSIFILLTFCSCSKDDTTDNDQVKYTNGVFVTNEGTYINGTGTLSFISNATGQITDNVFSSANDGQVLGNILNSMTIVEDKAYLIINNAAKIVVANAQTMKYITSIEGIDQPRYLVAANNLKAYVSYWGVDGLSGGIAVIDLMNNTIVKKIDLGAGPEKMIIKGNVLAVCMSGGFGRANTIQYLSIDTDELIDTFEVLDNPNSLFYDSNDNLWVLNGGFTDYLDPNNTTDGVLLRIDRFGNHKSISVLNGSSDLEVDISANKAYFLNADGVYQIDISAEDITTSLIFASQSYYYGMSLDADNDVIYLMDAKDFNSNGDVLKINTQGELLNSYTTGIIPNNCYFVD